MGRLRIVIGDDHPLIVAGIQAVLGRSHDVVGLASSGREFVEKALDRGATGYVVKTDVQEELADSVRGVMAGRT